MYGERHVYVTTGVCVLSLHICIAYLKPGIVLVVNNVFKFHT